MEFATISRSTIEMVGYKIDFEIPKRLMEKSQPNGEETKSTYDIISLVLTLLVSCLKRKLYSVLRVIQYSWEIGGEVT